MLLFLTLGFKPDLFFFFLCKLGQDFTSFFINVEEMYSTDVLVDSLQSCVAQLSHIL